MVAGVGGQRRAEELPLCLSFSTPEPARCPPGAYSPLGLHRSHRVRVSEFPHCLRLVTTVSPLSVRLLPRAVFATNDLAADAIGQEGRHSVL